MSRAFFDTSVLVPVVTEQLANHAAAHARFVRELNSGVRPCCSTHTLAECYATLTALPLPQKISGAEAARLIEANFSYRLEVVNLSAKDYRNAIRLCADLGRLSGQVYDALHLIAATKGKCTQLLTYNLKHFAGFHPQEPLQVCAP
ncbi:MAG TPA: PIN domain-containing protein [Opitutales bacterium]|nr:PIN domain-containing protein [Opitutales bacterium]